MIGSEARKLLKISDACDKGDITGLRLVAEQAVAEVKELERRNERLERECAEVPELEEKITDLEDELGRMKALSKALENVIWQEKHGMDSQGRDYVGTDGLSAYEEAFHFLKWDDPHFFTEKCPKCKSKAFWHNNMTMLVCGTCDFNTMVL